MELLHTRGVEPEIVYYLENPPDAGTLKELTRQLGCSIRQIIRSGESVYGELGLASRNLSEDDLIRIVIENPRLLERPIVVHHGKAAVGRPPENILSILQEPS